MTLSEFRALTASLDGDLELLCAGAPVKQLHEALGSIHFQNGDPQNVALALEAAQKTATSSAMIEPATTGGQGSESGSPRSFAGC